MRTFLLMAALALAGALPASAEDHLAIRVVDGVTGRPVPRAEVSILGHPGDRLTDDEGRAVWQPAPPPPFEILVVLPGGRYARPVLVERIPASGALEIRLETLVSEHVTVSAGASPHIAATPGSATTLVTSTEIEARMPATLSQAIESVAGVSTVSEGQAAVPAVRGFAGGRTLILLDGARVTSERRVGPSASFLDPFALESVEVARGPGSVAYGSDAFGGVIYARTRRVAPNTPLSVRLLGSFGAGIPEIRTGVEAARGFERGSLLVQAHARGMDDYRSPVGTILNSGARDRGFLARGEHALGPGVLSATWQSDFGRDVERPRNNSAAVRFFYPAEDSHRLTAGYDAARVAGFDRISTTAFVGSHAVVTDQDRAASGAAPRQIERSDVSARDFQARVTAQRSVAAAHLELGADVNGRYGLEAFEERVRYDAAGDIETHARETAVERARRTNAAVFASLQAPLGAHAVLGVGARGDRITSRNRGGFFGDRATASGAASGFVSLTAGSYRGWSATGQIARGFRDPLLSDRYYRGPTGRGFITGNPDLDAETSLQFDGALRYTSSRYRATIATFHYRIADLIERYETTADTFHFRNRGRAEMRGVEVEFQADLGNGLSLQTAAQLTRGRALDDNAPLDGVPAPSVMAQLHRALGARGFAQVRVAAHARDERPGPTERVTPGYTLVDLFGGWHLTSALEVRALARNVLDQRYLLSADTRTVPAPGASLAVTVTARIGGR